MVGDRLGAVALGAAALAVNDVVALDRRYTGEVLGKFSLAAVGRLFFPTSRTSVSDGDSQLVFATHPEDAINAKLNVTTVDCVPVDPARL